MDPDAEPRQLVKAATSSSTGRVRECLRRASEIKAGWLVARVLMLASTARSNHWTKHVGPDRDGFRTRVQFARSRNTQNPQPSSVAIFLPFPSVGAVFGPGLLTFPLRVRRCSGPTVPFSLSVLCGLLTEQSGEVVCFQGVDSCRFAVFVCCSAGDREWIEQRSPRR